MLSVGPLHSLVSLNLSSVASGDSTPILKTLEYIVCSVGDVVNSNLVYLLLAYSKELFLHQHRVIEECHETDGTFVHSAESCLPVR